MATTLHPQFITNEAGEKTAVILPIDEFQELMEDIDDLAAVADRRNEPTVSHEDVLAALKTDGFYRIEWKQSAHKELRHLPKDILARVLQAVAALSHKPMPTEARKLSGAERLYRLRIGDYRIIYFVYAERVIEIVRVRHRRDVYRDLS